MFTLAKAERFYFWPMCKAPFRSVRLARIPMVPMAKKLELLQMLEHVLFVYQNTNRQQNQRSPIVSDLLQKLNKETSHEVLYEYFGN